MFLKRCLCQMSAPLFGPVWTCFAPRRLTTPVGIVCNIHVVYERNLHVSMLNITRSSGHVGASNGDVSLAIIHFYSSAASPAKRQGPAADDAQAGAAGANFRVGIEDLNNIAGPFEISPVFGSRHLSRSIPT